MSEKLTPQMQHYVETELNATVNAKRWAVVTFKIDDDNRLDVRAIKFNMPEGIDEPAARAAYEALQNCSDFNKPQRLVFGSPQLPPGAEAVVANILKRR